MSDGLIAVAALAATFLLGGSFGFVVGRVTEIDRGWQHDRECFKSGFRTCSEYCVSRECPQRAAQEAE